MKAKSIELLLCSAGFVGSLCANITPDDPAWPSSDPAWWYNASDSANGVIDATKSELNIGNDVY